jgi:hypothetical protein
MYFQKKVKKEPERQIKSVFPYLEKEGPTKMHGFMTSENNFYVRPSIIFLNKPMYTFSY